MSESALFMSSNQKIGRQWRENFLGLGLGCLPQIAAPRYKVPDSSRFWALSVPCFLQILDVARVHHALDNLRCRESVELLHQWQIICTNLVIDFSPIPA